MFCYIDDDGECTNFDQTSSLQPSAQMSKKPPLLWWKGYQLQVIKTFYKTNYHFHFWHFRSNKKFLKNLFKCLAIYIIETGFNCCNTIQSHCVSNDVHLLYLSLMGQLYKKKMNSEYFEDYFLFQKSCLFLNVKYIEEFRLSNSLVYTFL